MKRIFWGIILPVLFINFILTDVSAKSYNEWELIPIDTIADVKTELFHYDDLFYNSSEDVNGYTEIEFGSIKNLSNKTIPVSISVGLFDSEEKNIGVVNYCSLSDKSSSYSGMEIKAGDFEAFSISLKPGKYNAEGTELSDVRYITIMSDNEYCKVGGASNYVGLDLEQMKNGLTNQQLELDESTKKKQSLIIFAAVILVVIIAYMIFGSVVSSLYIKMYNVWTAFAYVPIVNNYLSVKMSFGPIVSKVYIGVLLFSIILSLLGINILMYLVYVASGFAFIINIVKIFTKKYGLFYFGSTEFNSDGYADYVMSDRARMGHAMIDVNQSLEDDNTALSNNLSVNNNLNNDSDNVNTNINTNTNISLSDSNTSNDNINNDSNMNVNTMEVFDVNLNEQQNEINYVDSSTEYFNINSTSFNDFNSNNSTNNNVQNNSSNLNNNMSSLSNNNLNDVINSNESQQNEEPITGFSFFNDPSVNNDVGLEEQNNVVVQNNVTNVDNKSNSTKKEPEVSGFVNDSSEDGSSDLTRFFR